MTTSRNEANDADNKFMTAALQEARKASTKSEVPIGAVVVLDGKIIARAHNLKETRRDATAHAELIALRKAEKKLANWRLTGAILYVTLEPCPMCLSAIIQTRISRLVYGASDPVMGACGSRVDLTRVHPANPALIVIGGVSAKTSKALIDEFWRQRRMRT